MHFITIATTNYALHALRLIRSLRQQYPESSITLYGDSADLVASFSDLGVQLHVLPEINMLGVKRAKFLAYAHAAKNGGFIYLDADILVIDSLPDLLYVNQITACRDDLRECPFICNPAYPWVSSPNLSGEKYFNSGVFAVPVGYAEFFDTINKEAADNDEWSRFTIPGKLYDNHFLCAKIAQYSIPVNFISEYEYNWQGFKAFGDLNCYVDDSGHLRSYQENKLLRLVHFAGIKDIDSYISSLPPEIAATLARSIGKSEEGSLEMINCAMNSKIGIEPRLKVIMAQAMCQSQVVQNTNPGAEQTLVGFQPSLASIVHSVQESDFLWNDLKCGAAYLSAPEYHRLRSFVVDADIRAVLELGAGYTTALFSRLGCKQIAVEGWDGPWLEFARKQGAEIRLVPFTSGVGFQENDLIACVEKVDSASGKKMVFIDSPPGTANRSCVVEQVIRLASGADYYVVHDSVRDSPIVYRLCSALGLMVVDHYPSLRGLTFLGKPCAFINKTKLPQRSLKERMECMRFDVRLCEKNYAPDGRLQSLFICLINTGSEIITTVKDDLGFSFHLMDESGNILLWDTLRYKLPVDLLPNDSVSFRVDVSSYSEDRVIAIFDFVREGEFWWSDIAAVSRPTLALGESSCNANV